MVDEQKKDKQNTPVVAKVETKKVIEEKESVTDVKVKEEKKETKIPAKFKSLVEEVEKMSVLDLSELVKILEDKFGVSASAPAMMMSNPVADDSAAAVEEKSEFDVELINFGENKISVIKVIKALTGLGLADAKALVDNAPKLVKEGVKKEEAEEMKKKIEEAGGKVELK